MASDRIVTPRHVLAAVMQLQRCGSDRILSDLESLEPDLAEEPGQETKDHSPPAPPG